MIKRMVSTFAALAVFLVGWVVAGPVAPAQAAPWCAGHVIYRAPVMSGAVKIGELLVYWSGNQGVNCAVMNHAGPTAGVQLRTAVFLAVCRERTPGPVCTFEGQPQAEDGFFRYYAGPKYVYGRNRCIHAAGDIYYNGRKHHVETRRVADHCSNEN